MPYFVPKDPKAEIRCYGGSMCSVKNPVFLDGHLAAKAMANPAFMDVLESEPAKTVEKPVRKTRKKVSKK